MKFFNIQWKIKRLVLKIDLIKKNNINIFNFLFFFNLIINFGPLFLSLYWAQVSCHLMRPKQFATQTAATPTCCQCRTCDVPSQPPSRPAAQLPIPAQNCSVHHPGTPPPAPGGDPAAQLVCRNRVHVHVRVHVQVTFRVLWLAASLADRDQITQLFAA